MQPWLTGIITRSKTADLSPSDWSTGQYGPGTLSTSSFPASIVLSPRVHPATTQVAKILKSSHSWSSVGNLCLCSLGSFLKTVATPRWGRNLSVSLSAPVSHYRSSRFAGLQSREGGMELSGLGKSVGYTGTLSDSRGPPTRLPQPSPGAPSHSQPQNTWMEGSLTESPGSQNFPAGGV